MTSEERQQTAHKTCSCVPEFNELKRNVDDIKWLLRKLHDRLDNEMSARQCMYLFIVPQIHLIRVHVKLNCSHITDTHGMRIPVGPVIVQPLQSKRSSYSLPHPKTTRKTTVVKSGLCYDFHQSFNCFVYS